ncbi:AraC family transcriptional regulator [Streptomyces sp. NPDC059455]|uniref:helix-turn-helix transcriptional regulator n=1 Tax=Streptomyces sp. NPDC059455 TaxID=3346837 RepID=UPI00368B080A
MTAPRRHRSRPDKRIPWRRTLLAPRREARRVRQPHGPGFQRERHSTAALPADRRTGFWSDLVRSVHCPMDLRYSSHDNYHGSLKLQRSAHNQVVQWQSVEPLDITRRAKGAERELHQIIAPLRGCFRKEQNDRSVVCEPGRMTIIDQSRGYRFSQPGRLTAVMLTIPTDELAATLGGLPRTAEPIDIHEGIGRIFLSMLREVATSDTLDSRVFDLACTHVRELLSAAVGERGGADESTREAYRRAIFRHIRTHLANPDLGTAHVAAELRLSPRYVQVLLQEIGTTTRDHIRSERLQAARDLLERTNRPIGQIAQACGFPSASTFGAQFRKQFAMSPREVRASRPTLEVPTT